MPSISGPTESDRSSTFSAPTVFADANVDDKLTGNDGAGVFKCHGDSQTDDSATTIGPESGATQDDAWTAVGSDPEVRVERQRQAEERDQLWDKTREWMGHDAWDEQESIKEREYTQDGELVDSSPAEPDPYFGTFEDSYRKERCTMALVSPLDSPGYMTPELMGDV